MTSQNLLENTNYVKSKTVLNDLRIQNNNMRHNTIQHLFIIRQLFIKGIYHVPGTQDRRMSNPDKVQAAFVEPETSREIDRHQINTQQVFK